MRWTVHGHRDVYASEWVRVSLDDVKIPLKPPYKVPNKLLPQRQRRRGLPRRPHQGRLRRHLSSPERAARRVTPALSADGAVSDPALRTAPYVTPPRAGCRQQTYIG